MNSLQGQLLIASPKLRDPNFLKAVVFMVQHSEEGAMGLVLNRPSSTAVREAWEQVKNTPCPLDMPLYHGGPCPAPLMAIHNVEPFHEVRLLPNVFFSASREALDAIVAAPDATVRLFAGCAGWAGGQLEAELEEGAWLTSATSADQVFSTADDLWEQVAKQVAQASLFSVIPIRHIPDDPSVN